MASMHGRTFIITWRLSLRNRLLKSRRLGLQGKQVVIICSSEEPHCLMRGTHSTLELIDDLLQALVECIGRLDMCLRGYAAI